jgi:hypothetical protein
MFLQHIGLFSFDCRTLDNTIVGILYPTCIGFNVCYNFNKLIFHDVVYSLKASSAVLQQSAFATEELRFLYGPC